MSFDQGMRAAERDFPWCSRMVRIGITDYTCAGCDEDVNREKWLAGYAEHFRRMNEKPRKNQVPLPRFNYPKPKP